jgi:dethiobiotin synthetase
MSYFVTGTDTGVGKTLVSCALLHAFAEKNKHVAGFKPVAAGCDGDGFNNDAKALRAASTATPSYEQVNPYCLRAAIAPHVAAQQEDVRIELSRIVTAYRDLAEQAEVVIAEGAGGFLVPLNEEQDGSDLAKELGLPIIVVVGMRLGCLNHALLTVRAIEDSGLECAAWVANVLDEKMAVLPENIATLQQRIAAPLLGIICHMPAPDAYSAADMLDISKLAKD